MTMRHHPVSVILSIPVPTYPFDFPGGKVLCYFPTREVEVPHGRSTSGSPGSVRYGREESAASDRRDRTASVVLVGTRPWLDHPGVGHRPELSVAHSRGHVGIRRRAFSGCSA